MNKQEELWSGEFGTKYTEENSDYGANVELFNHKHHYTLQKVYEEIFMDLDRNYRIIDIGCNVGHKLELLRRMGFKNLYGLDTNLNTLITATAKYPDIHFIHANFSDWKTREQFDIVMTNYSLIHVSPEFIKETLRKCYDFSARYLFHLEFDTTSTKQIEIPWLNKRNICWKRNMNKFYDGLLIEKLRDISLNRSEDNNFDSAILWHKSINV